MVGPGAWVVVFFQAEDGIRDLVRSRGLGDVYKRQAVVGLSRRGFALGRGLDVEQVVHSQSLTSFLSPCLLYTSDAADERSSVDLGGRRIINKKKPAHVDGRQRTEKSKTSHIRQQ